MDVLSTPKLPLADWLSVMEREYLSAFVPAGGAAVKPRLQQLTSEVNTVYTS